MLPASIDLWTRKGACGNESFIIGFTGCRRVARQAGCSGRVCGILPQLGILLRIPEDFRLYDPEDPKPPEEEIEYERTFPFGAEAAIKRGYSLPLPIGISAIYVSIKPEQDLEGDVYLWQSHMAATGQ
jgi:hypothetical protein